MIGSLKLLIITSPLLVLMLTSGQDAVKSPTDDYKKSSNLEATKAWEKLSEDEQNSLRKVLREVWSDPKVVSARDNVHRSTTEYKSAVSDAISRQDPEVAELLKQFQSGGRHGHPNSKRGMRSFEDGLISSPYLMERMTDEQKKRFPAAAKLARETPAVQAAWAELKKIHKQDEEMRNRKTKALQKYRQEFFQALIKEEPDLKDVLPKPGTSGPKGMKGKGGKGKGMRSLTDPPVPIQNSDPL